MYRFRRKCLTPELKYALVIRARFNRSYNYKLNKIKIGLSDDLQY